MKSIAAYQARQADALAKAKEIKDDAFTAEVTAKIDASATTFKEVIKDTLAKIPELPDATRAAIQNALQGSAKQEAKPAEQVDVNQKQDTQVTVPVEETADWKVYTNQDFGIEMKFPAEYKQDSGDTSFSNKNAQVKIRAETVGGGYCFLGLCSENSKDTVLINGINWDYLGSSQYCDAGECSSMQGVYRTTYAGYRYYLIFVGENPEKEILSTLKFISANPTPEGRG